MALQGFNKYVNFYRTSIAAEVDPFDIQIEVVSTEGLPDVSGSEYFYLTLNAIFTEIDAEIVKVTNVVGTLLTVERGQGDTTAQAWAEGDRVNGNFVAVILDDLQDDWDLAETGLRELIDQNNSDNTVQTGAISVLTIQVGENTALADSNAADIIVEEGRIDDLELIGLSDITPEGAAAFYDVQGAGVSTADPIAVLSDISALAPGGIFTKFQIEPETKSFTFDFVAPVAGVYRFVINGQWGVEDGSTATLFNATLELRVFNNLIEVYDTRYVAGGAPLVAVPSEFYNAHLIFEVELDSGTTTIIGDLVGVATPPTITVWSPISAPNSESHVLVIVAEVT